MWLAMIAFWALLIWAIYALVTGITRKPGQRETGGQGQQPDSALRILDERLARGEIDADEYRRLREVLDGTPGRPAGTGSGRYQHLPVISRHRARVPGWGIYR